MEASFESGNVLDWTEGTLPRWVGGLPVIKEVLARPKTKVLMLRLTLISSMSFLVVLALMMLKNPPYFGVIMNVAGRQLLLSQRTKICRHQIEAEKTASAR